RSRLLLLLAFAVAGFTVPASGQQRIPIFEPSTTNTGFVVVCLDQFGFIVPNCNLSDVSGGALVNSGGHIHHDPFHPFSNITPTSGNTGANGLPITIRTTIVGQIEATISCIPGRCDATPFAVGFNDLFELLSGDGIELVGSTTAHPINHSGTLTMLNGILSTNTEYLSKHPEQGRLALNDMALELGGIFDLGLHWTGPHFDHSRGNAVDVRGNSLPFAIPKQLQNEYVQICRANGATSLATGIHELGTDDQHVHCEWP
ncbi:MAG: hypothetical protein ACRD4L_03470, partial [Pyrinomonadaceae bacterium]